MTSIRRLSLPAHGAVELLVGLALLGLPFVLQLGGAPLVVAVAAGIVVAGIGLSAADAIPLRTHLALDQGVVAALVGAALAMAVGGQAAAAALLGMAGLAQLALVSGTRWSRRR
jgi:hypothetical protein